MANTEYNRFTGMTYFSKSRKVEIPIADHVQFNDFHLVAAFNKAKDELEFEGDPSALDAVVAMARELGYRDLLPTHKGGMPPGDPRLPLPEAPEYEEGDGAPWGA